MLAWTKQINAEGNADSRIISRWSKSHATSNFNKSKSNGYEPQLTELFVLFRFLLNVPVNHCSVMSGQSHRFHGITSTFGR